VIVDTNTSITLENMSLTTIANVRTIGGFSQTTDISDDDLTILLGYAAQRTISDTYRHIYHENIGPNPDTGNLWNGVNYTFQIQNPPLGNRDGNSIVDASDIDVVWIDVDYGVHTDATVTIISASEGILTIKNGSDPLVSSVLYVWVDYYTPYGDLDTVLLEAACGYYCAHLAHLRLTEPDKVTLADLSGNQPVIEMRPSRFREEYDRLIREIRYPLLRGI